MAGNVSHDVHSSKRLKLEPWGSAPLGQSTPQALHNLEFTGSGFLSDGLGAAQFIDNSGAVTQASSGPQSHILPSQGMSASFPAPSAMTRGPAAGTPQHRPSLDDRHQQHVSGLQPLSVPSSINQSHHQHGGLNTPTSATHMMPPASASASATLVGMGSAGVNPGSGPPMAMPQRSGSIQHSPLTQDQAAASMLGHFQLGLGQGQIGGPNTTPSPVLNTNMGLSIPMYQQQQAGQIMTTYPPRRKAIRAAQACDACRARKAKCDEGRPSCGFCKESGVPCVYREVPPPKQDRTLLQILDRLGRIEGMLSQQQSGVANQDTPARMPLQTAPTGDGLSSTHQDSPRASVSQSNEPGLHLGPAALDAVTEDDDDMNFPYQHTTAAHKLLSWPSIRTLVQDDCGEWGVGFVHAVEESRGNLQIWGKGESRNGTAYADPNSWFDEGESEGVGSFFRNWQDKSTIPEEPLMDSMWGNENAEGYTSGISDVLSHAGGLAPDRVSLNLQPEVIHELLQSYLRNIHILHPILDKNRISQMVQLFGEKTSQGTVSSPAAQVPRAGPQGQRMSVGEAGSSAGIGGRTTSPATGKRKRATSISGPAPPTSSFGYPPSRSSTAIPQKVPRTIHSAVVLLVLALGAICLHRRPVPGPVSATSRQPASTHDPISPFSTTHSQFPTDSGSISESAFHDSPTGEVPQSGKELRNIDVIPGLAYFAKAAEIIGSQAGANELENVQAGLLAGLYWGQLGRVLDSWKWISWACMGCQVLVRLKYQQETNPLRKELIQRAFWSCQQLESDVLAELDLPPSGISRLEDEVRFPGGDTVAGIGNDSGNEGDDSIFMYYLAQIALRKLLNRVHTELYKQRDHPTPITRSLSVARELDFQLERWKSTLPEALRWDESDPPSADINAARLRAKYFGARYIIHRPFVYLRIHGNGSISGGLPATSPPLSGIGSQTDSPIVQPGGLSQASRKASVAMSGMPLADEQLERAHPLEESCKKCLDAAVQSTRAFHAFSTRDNRPIITNVFGTAHAQFGNLLVLQAAYNSSQLNHLVDGNVLEDLFQKTMEWLRTLSPISPALNQDWIILRGVYSRNGPAIQHQRHGLA